MRKLNDREVSILMEISSLLDKMWSSVEKNDYPTFDKYHKEYQHWTTYFSQLFNKEDFTAYYTDLARNAMVQCFTIMQLTSGATTLPIDFVKGYQKTLESRKVDAVKKIQHAKNFLRQTIIKGVKD